MPAVGKPVDFNPRYREDSDMMKILSKDKAAISIHAIAKIATSMFSTISSSADLISIHAIAKIAT